MDVTTVGAVLLVCWALILIVVVILVARWFFKADRDDGRDDGPRS
jgi:hypothetical protein